MVQWPPSPSVQDEVTALAEEHSLDAAVHSLKSDNQGAVDPGAVDQYPVIIDAPDLPETTQSKTEDAGLQEHHKKDGGFSDDSRGPKTPPPLLKKHDKKSESSFVEDSTSRESSLNTPVPSNIAERPSSRGRPQVTRIQTDMGGDLRAMATGARREPSPYSYTRAPLPHLSGAGLPMKTEPFLSPAHAMASPNPLTQPIDSVKTFGSAQPPHSPTAMRSPTAASSRHALYNGNASGSTTQSIPRASPVVNFEPFVQHDHPYRSERHSTYEPSSSRGARIAPPSPPHSRRPSRESSHRLSSDEKLTSIRPSYSRRTTRDVKDSPHSSSTEDSSRKQRHGMDRNSDGERTRIRRRSSRHRERPVLEEVGSVNRVDNIPSAAPVWSDSKGYQFEPRDKKHLLPVFSSSGSYERNAMEDQNYFVNAFKESEQRRSRVGYGPRSSGSALASPMSSPPRTPQSERKSKDYFDSANMLQRPVQRSRPPSTDNGVGQFEPAIASVTGAAGVALLSSTLSRFPGTSAETSSNLATSKAPGAQRSGRPSPVTEDIIVPSQNTIRTATEPFVQPRSTLSPLHNVRPISRGSVTATEATFIHHIPQPTPQRALSYSGSEYSKPLPHTLSAVSPTQNHLNVTTYNVVPQDPNIHSSSSRNGRSPVTIIKAALPTLDTFGFAPCPRPRPVAGYNDWFTIKEMSNVDICPTCMQTMAGSRFRDLFIPSLPRPYNEPSFCAMSMIWNRIAFQQAVTRKLSGLTAIRKIMDPKYLARPCRGSSKDPKLWYKVYDLRTRSPVSNIFVCPACVHSVDAVFETLADVFDRHDSSSATEEVCSFHADSKHFLPIVSSLDKVERRIRGRKWRSSDVEPLIEHLRRVGRYQPCPKDDPNPSRGWHVMTDLPEFTVCEECYEEVVVPIQTRPLAEEISKTLKVIPSPRTRYGKFTNSCQLYSDRMRKIFMDAVAARDFELLHRAVLSRLENQHRLRDLTKLLEEDIRFGIDRRAELERNKQIWRTHHE